MKRLVKSRHTSSERARPAYNDKSTTEWPCLLRPPTRRGQSRGQASNTSLQSARATATRAFNIPRLDRQVPRPPAKIVLAAKWMDRRFDQRPPQPRRARLGDAPAPVALAAALDPRQQARVTCQMRSIGKPADRADLGAQRQAEHGAEAGTLTQRARDRIARRDPANRRQHRDQLATNVGGNVPQRTCWNNARAGGGRFI